MRRLPHRKVIPLVAFGALMICAIPINLAFLRSSGADLSTLDVGLKRLLSGRVTDELTSRYNGASPFKDFGINLFGSFSFFVFHEARGAAQIGTDGVLFSNEEFETDARSRTRIAEFISHVGEVNAALKARGIVLIAAPLPLKVDLEAEHLGDDLHVPDELATRYTAVMEALSDIGVPAADIRADMLAGRELSPVFLRSDTHWTTHGAGMAAKSVAGLARQIGFSGETRFNLITADARPHEGDLKTFVRLFASLRHLGPPDDVIQPVTAQAASNQGAGDALFGDESIPVVMVGTSYSADAAFGFEAQLKTELGLDVLNLSEPGKGPLAPMRAFMAGDVLKDMPPKLVIWEMPIRYMDDVFPQDEPNATQ